MKWLQPNMEFHREVMKYEHKDSFLAIGLFCIINVLYVFAAALERNNSTIKENPMIVGCVINGIMIVTTLLFIKIRKQKLSSIGLCKGKWKQSCLIGLILAVVLFFNNCLSYVIGGADFIEVKDIFRYVIFYLMVALCEEIVFRGYIGTRLYGLIKNQYIVILVSGILFIIMHFPYRMIAYGMTIRDLTISNIGWLLDLFITHIVLSLIYLKTNSLYGSIIPHWMSNLAYNLIIR